MSDAAKLLVDHLDVWIGAIERNNSTRRGNGGKVSLYGIEKLRALILDLAVRGKLVLQDPTDEQALELLNQIQSEKRTAGVKSQVRSVSGGAGPDGPERLPTNWTWTTLEDISSYIQRGKGPTYDDSGTVQVISQKCIQWSGFDLSPARRISDESLSAYQAERFLQYGDVLWNSTGTGTVGRANVFDDMSGDPMVVDSHVTIVRPVMIEPRFLTAYIASSAIQARMNPEHKAPLVSGTTNQVELNVGAVRTLPFPLPPLQEQRRIVTKVDELMALCDALETGTLEAMAAHEKLVRELLATLANSPDPGDLAANWFRIESHFDLLFTTEESIEALKQVIMELAVRGRLVLQNPADEPASGLLAKVKLQRARWISEKRIRNGKPLDAIRNEDCRFSAPIGWEWTRFGHLGDWGAGATPDRNTSAYFGGDTPWFKSGELVGDFISHSEETVTALALRECSLRLNQPGDVLLAMYGATIGKTSILEVEATTNQAVCACTPFEGVFNRFLLLMLKAMRPIFVGQGAGGAQPNISREKIVATSLCLPPSAEQKRIVAKVDELFSVCDEFKSRLGTSRQQAVTLAGVLASAGDA